jgi:uncharacterized repeat protein (TIGR04076 family)
MTVDENAWIAMQQYLGYTDEEMNLFRNNPKNQVILSKVPELMNKIFVLEVVESHGCNSQHNVGDKFYFNAKCELLIKPGMRRICVFALNSVSALLFASSEMILAGMNPNDICFKRCGCFGVGVKCGGWGRIVMELKVVENKRDDVCYGRERN